MDQILNIEERRQAFFKFLAFFLITVILVVIAIYFNFKIPSKENEWLQNQAEIRRNQEANQAKFVSKMDEAMMWFDSLEKKDANVSLVHTRLTKTIGEMQELEQNDKTLFGKMNKAIVAKFDQLQRTKKEIVGIEASAEKLSKLENDLKVCERDLADCRSRNANINRDIE